MRRRIITALTIALAVPVIGHAQSLPSILALVAQHESSGNPTAQNPNPNSTAGGLFGDVNGTWASALSLCGGACGTIAQYPTASSAPPSVQAAANVALMQDHGLSDWTCQGCDPALTADINAAGGASAFSSQIASLSTNPASYASFDSATSGSGMLSALTTMNTAANTDTGGGVGVADSTSAAATTDPPVTAITDPTTGMTVFSPGGDGATFNGIDTTHPLTGTATVVSVTSTPSALSSSFSLLWKNTVGSVQGATSGMIQAVQLMVAHYYKDLLALAIVVLGYRTMIGRMNTDDLLRFTIAAAIVTAFITVGSTWYQAYVIDPVIGLPTWWQSWISTGIGAAGGSNPPTAVTMLDQVHNAIFAAVDKMMASTSPGWIEGAVHDFFIAILGAVTGLMADIGLWMMFGSVWSATILSYVLLIIGPIILPFALFPVTRGIVLSWVWGLGAILASLFMSSVLLALWESQLVRLLGVATVSGTPDTDAPGFIQLGFLVIVLGASMASASVLAGWIFGHALDHGLNRVSYHFSGQSVADGATAGARWMLR